MSAANSNAYQCAVIFGSLRDFAYESRRTIGEGRCGLAQNLINIYV